MTANNEDFSLAAEPSADLGPVMDIGSSSWLAVRLSEKALAICGKYWKSDASGPAKTCCHQCPISSQCGAGCKTTPDSISAHNHAINEAAELVS